MDFKTLLQKKITSQNHLLFEGNKNSNRALEKSRFFLMKLNFAIKKIKSKELERFRIADRSEKTQRKAK